MRSGLLLFAIVLGGVTLSSYSTADDAKKDAEKLQGTWAAVTYIQDGTGDEAPIPAAESSVKWHFKGDKVSFQADVEGAAATGTIKLDASKTPKTMDLTFPPAPGTKKGQTIVGIYKFDGDTFTICYDPELGKRPTEFKSVTGTKAILASFEQLKK